eukprot:6189130-Pleurochrysis_carterae.AAC.1
MGWGFEGGGRELACPVMLTEQGAADGDGLNAFDVGAGGGSAGDMDDEGRGGGGGGGGGWQGVGHGGGGCEK